MERKDIQELYRAIRRLHPNTPPDKIPKLTNRLADQWIKDLSGYTLEQAIEAAEAHAAKCRFWPHPSEVLAQLPPRPHNKSTQDAHRHHKPLSAR